MSCLTDKLLRTRVQSARSGIQPHSHRLLFTLLWLVIASELLYLFLLAISPLPALDLSPTPLPTSYSWLLLPFQWLYPQIQTLASHFEALPALLLGATLIALSALYILALFQFYRLKAEDNRRWLSYVLGSTLLFGLTLILLPRLFSDNIFTYMFAGRVFSVYHLDPLQTAPLHIPGDPYAAWIFSNRDEPSIYAPLWFYISALLTQISTSPALALFLFKGFALLAHLLNILLVWAILGRLAPTRRLIGTLMYAWNPLVLIELAGNGHNEGLLMFLLLLATWCALKHAKPGYASGAFLCFGLAISTNLIALLLAPLYAWFAVDHTRSLWRVACDASWRLLVMLAPPVLLFLPLWHGTQTFFALTSAIDMEHFVHSPAGILALPLRSLFTWFAQTTHMPAYLNPIASADMALRASASFIFVLIYLRRFGELRDARLSEQQTQSNTGTISSLASVDTLVNGWTITIFWYLLLVSGWFWPWYILWLFWAVVLRRLDGFTFALLGLTGTVLLLYAFTGFSREPIATYQIAIIFGLPLVYLLIDRIREYRLQR